MLHSKARALGLILTMCGLMWATSIASISKPVLWLLQVIKQTVQDKGVGGLFTGMGPRVTQTAVMSAVFFSLFEFWKAQLKR